MIAHSKNIQTPARFDGSAAAIERRRLLWDQLEPDAKAWMVETMWPVLVEYGQQIDPEIEAIRPGFMARCFVGSAYVDGLIDLEITTEGVCSVVTKPGFRELFK